MNINNFENIDEEYKKNRSFFDDSTNTMVVFENNHNNSWEKEHFNKSLGTRLQITDNLTNNSDNQKYFGNNDFFVGKTDHSKNIINSLSNMLDEINLKIRNMENRLSHLLSRVNLLKNDYSKRNEIKEINQTIQQVQQVFQQQKQQREQIIEQIRIQQNINTPIPINREQQILNQQNDLLLNEPIIQREPTPFVPRVQQLMEQQPQQRMQIMHQTQRQISERQQTNQAPQQRLQQMQQQHQHQQHQQQQQQQQQRQQQQHQQQQHQQQQQLQQQQQQQQQQRQQRQQHQRQLQISWDELNNFEKSILSRFLNYDKQSLNQDGLNVMVNIAKIMRTMENMQQTTENINQYTLVMNNLLHGTNDLTFDNIQRIILYIKSVITQEQLEEIMRNFINS
jgi:hypothetical protein